jgi:hypothetical protein
VKRIDLAGEVGASPSLNTNLAGVVKLIISMSSYKKLPRRKNVFPAFDQLGGV